MPSLSLRQKMLLPAGVALVATALASGAAFVFLRGAERRLTEVERRDFAAHELSRELVTGLQVIQGRLADARDPDGLELVDDLQRTYAELLVGPRAEALGPDRAAHLREELARWYPLARSTTERLLRNDVGRDLPAALREVADRREALEAELADESDRAQAALVAGLTQARAAQRAAIWVGGLVLLAGALLGAAVAGWLAARATAPVRALTAAALRIADGDLAADLPPETADEIGTLTGSFAKMAARLRQIVATLKQGSHELASAAHLLAEATQEQRVDVERQADGLARTSGNTRQLEQASQVAAARANAVLDVARRGADRSVAGQAAAELGAAGVQQIRGAVDGIVGESTRLLEQTRQVGDIVETVRDLATQSHVLSLNASIEAARAGEAGRGFAVVAAEVRALAHQSGQSAARIAKIVQDILEAIQATLDMTERGNRGMEGSLGQIRASEASLREIGALVRETSAGALEIASAVQQQSGGIAEIALAVGDLDRGMEGTLRRIQTLEDSALAVAQTAMRISAIANGFRGVGT